jgi:hypothetical protein
MLIANRYAEVNLDNTKGGSQQALMTAGNGDSRGSSVTLLPKLINT